MSLHPAIIRMKKLFRRLKLRRKGHPDQEMDHPSVGSLVHLVDIEDPDPELFSRVEALLDKEVAPETRKDTSRTTLFAAMAFGVCFGAILGFGASVVSTNTQKILAKPDAKSAWVPLGSVTFHGEALRAFVRAKCEGQTHFYVTMHGGDAEDSGPLVPLMASGEKILVDCIF